MDSGSARFREEPSGRHVGAAVGAPALAALLLGLFLIGFGAVVLTGRGWGLGGSFLGLGLVLTALGGVGLGSTLRAVRANRAADEAARLLETMPVGTCWCCEREEARPACAEQVRITLLVEHSAAVVRGRNAVVDVARGPACAAADRAWRVGWLTVLGGGLSTAFLLVVALLEGPALLVAAVAVGLLSGAVAVPRLVRSRARERRRAWSHPLVQALVAQGWTHGQVRGT